MVAVAETIRTPRKRRLPGSGTLSFIGRLFRDKPLGAFGFVICVIFLFCGVFADALAPYGYNQISPINRLSRRRRNSGWAPTISAATCSRAASTARSSR